VVVRYRNIISGAFILDDVDPAEHGAQGNIDDYIGFLFDDDGVYPQGLGVDGVLELETQDAAVGEEGELEAVPEGAVPVNGAVVGCVAGDDKAPWSNVRERLYGYGAMLKGRHGCTSRKAALFNQFPCNTGPKGLMTAVRILKFLRSKNLQLTNGMEAIC
jgi:hypothetical protein